MKPLDEITRRMFPTLAAQEDRMWWWRGVCIVGIILSAYVLGRDVLSAYQGRVATENMSAMVGRVNHMEEMCQKEYPARLKTTKVQAWNDARERDKGKEERP